MSLNKVMLIGNVGKDPEVRYLENNPQNPAANPKVATFTLATSERFRDRNGELRENTEWHNIVAWRNSADVAEKFIRKGTQVYIEGRLRTRKYTDKDGKDRYTTEVVVDNLQLLGKRPEDGAAPLQAQQPRPQQGYAQGGYQGGYQQSAAPVPPSPVAPPVQEEAAPSDDLPF
ncbi:MAG: single-stranded DNA-binding protein [Bacteroidales bacterium]|nr:single-stranded DNA-binding protein [Bacteroidales bacterium]